MSNLPNPYSNYYENYEEWEEYVRECLKNRDDYEDGLLELGHLSQEGEQPMTKHWVLEGSSSTHYLTLAEAVEAGKRKTKKNAYDTLVIYEAVQAIVTPTPDYQVVAIA